MADPFEGEAAGALAPTAVERPAGPRPAAEAARLGVDASTLVAPAGAVDAAGATAGADGATAPVRAQSARPRLDIPGFRLLGVLGEGGMGTVYAGEQDAPRRPVAIKVLHSTSTAALTRFLAEAEIMARLDHPGIAKVLEAGEADGHPYFVMERVEGVTLDAHVRAQAVPLAGRLELFVQLCDAIHHAHVKGVIHRDLKPSNVMVRGDGRVAVLDFGIARVAVAGGSSGGDTRAGELIGTPVYMSPEQARLRPDEVDARSDVYTLGVMLYELAAGELPYDVRGKSLPDVARAICEEPPRPLGRWGADLRGDLEAIADKALAKEPERRYHSAAALADDVRRHREGAAISARVPGTLEQVRRFARRRPGAAAAIVAAVVGGAVFAAVITSLWLEARAARRSAEAERARLAVAHDELEARNNQLVLDQARAALARDPTEALGWLATLTERGTDAGAAWAIADEARGRGAARAVLRGHRDEVRWVEAVPGGGALVSGGYDGRVLWWDDGARAPRLLWQAPGRVHVVRPSPDGRLVAIGGDGGVCRVVDTSGAAVAELPGLGGDVEKLAWSADGAWLAAGDDHGGVWVWPRGGDAGAGRRLDGPSVEIEALEFAARRGLLVAGDDGGGVWRWDLASGGGGAVAAVGAEVVAVWTDAGRVQALDATGTLHRWGVAGAAVTALPGVATGLAAKTGAFARDGSAAVLAGADGQVARLAGDVGAALGTHGAQVRSVAISDDGGRVATGGDDGSLRLWDLARGRQLRLRGHLQRVRQLGFARGGDELLAGDSEGVVRRWDVAGVPPTVLDGHAAAVERLAVSPDGSHLASADGGGELRVWTLGDGGGVRLGSHGARVGALAFAGAAQVVSAGADGTVAWWGVRPGPRHTVAGPVLALAATGDGARVAAATSAGPIALFGGDGAPGPVLRGHDGGTDALAFSPDGALLASGGQDRVVRVWTVAAPDAPPLELGPIADDTRHLVFAPAGDRLIAAGDDGQVRAWTIRDGAVVPSSLRVLASHAGAVADLHLGAAGDTLITTGRDHRVLEIELVGDVVRERGSRPPSPGPALVIRGSGGGRLATGGEDGAIVVRSLAPRSVAALRAALGPAPDR